MSDTCIIVKPTPGLTPEQAREARARAWRFVFDCYAKKKTVTGEEIAGGGNAGEDAKKEKNEFHKGTPKNTPAVDSAATRFSNKNCNETGNRKDDT